MKLIPTLNEYYKQLEHHDWFYDQCLSDEFFTQGVKEKWELLEVAKLSTVHAELYRSFYLHKFAKGEKPVQPEVAA